MSNVGLAQVTLGMTEEMVWRTLGQPQGGIREDIDKTGPFRLLKYGQHRGGGHYELQITIRNGVVAKVDQKPRSGTPAPSPAMPVPMQALAPPVMAAPSPARTSGGGKTLTWILLVLLLGGVGAYFFFDGNSSPSPRPRIHLPGN